MKAYHYTDEGKTWLRIDDEGYGYEEPIAGWSLVLDLTDGKSYYRHTDGREFESL